MKEQINQFRWIAIFGITMVALYLCWLMLRPFITVLEWAAVLVIVFYPVNKFLASKIKRRSLSALFSTILVIVVVALPLVMLSMAVTKELAGAARDIPTHLTPLKEPGASIIEKVSRWVQENLSVNGVGPREFVMEQLKSAGAALFGQSLGLVGNIAAGFVRAFFVVITMYYLFRDGDKIVQGLPAVLPFNNRQSHAILERITKVIQASVYGVVMIAALQGLLGGIAFWALGVPSPILWGVLLAFVCMIPIAGSFFVWLPASVYLALTGHLAKGLLLVLWGAFVISTVDNFLRPKLIKKQTKLHELFVFFSVLGGMSVFGLLGIVLGPVVLAVTLGLLQTFRDQTEEQAAAPITNEPIVADLSNNLPVH